MSVQLEFCKQRYLLLDYSTFILGYYVSQSCPRFLEGAFVNKDGWIGRNQYFGRGWAGRVGGSVYPT